MGGGQDIKSEWEFSTSYISYQPTSAENQMSLQFGTPVLQNVTVSQHPNGIEVVYTVVGPQVEWSS